MVEGAAIGLSLLANDHYNTWKGLVDVNKPDVIISLIKYA